MSRFQGVHTRGFHRTYFAKKCCLNAKSLLCPDDVRDETGVQNMTALPRAKWAELYKTLMKNPTNRRSLNLMGSAIAVAVLETEDPADVSSAEMTY